MRNCSCALSESAPQLVRTLGECTRTIPHLLSMTATPIPRTLTLTVYGDLDLSLIDQLPKGRKKIITKIISPEERKTTYEFIRKEVKNGGQAFVICPRIEGNELKRSCLPPDMGEVGPQLMRVEPQSPWADVKAVKEEYEKLSKEIFPDLKVAMLHGKMPGLEKEKTMRNFKNKKIDILVSTSVVEVGIDVPNATVMAIERADRFGFGQIPQILGKSGGGGKQSNFFFFFSYPLFKKKISD